MKAAGSSTSGGGSLDAEGALAKGTGAGAWSGLDGLLLRKDANVFAVFDAVGATAGGFDGDGLRKKFDCSGGALDEAGVDEVKAAELLSAPNPEKPVNFAGADIAWTKY